MSREAKAIVVWVVLFALSSGYACAAQPEFVLPPSFSADGREFTQAGGIAGANVFDGGHFSLMALAEGSEDQAMASAVWEVVHEIPADATHVYAVFRLGHMSGAQGIEWWGQLCCNAVATPYVVTPTGMRLSGEATRLDGVPLPTAVSQVLAALGHLAEGHWIPQGAWKVAQALADACEREMGPLFGQLLRAVGDELALVVLSDALESLGYLGYQEVRLAVPVTDDGGRYVFGLTIECWACPMRPGANVAWTLGRLEEVELEFLDP